MSQSTVWKEFKRSYGFDEIALVPSHLTLDPSLVDISTKIAGIDLKMPILGSAMDSVVSPKSAIALGKHGALGVLNLEGVQTRYDEPDIILKEIASVSKAEYVNCMQAVYQKNPVREDLVQKRIKEIKEAGVPCVVSSTPINAEWLGPIAAEAGADAFLVQSTVVSIHHKSMDGGTPLNLKAFCQHMPIPVMVGNSATYSVTLELMESGVSAVFVGIGPGAACTTRGVLGIGVPMASSVRDAVQARVDFFEKTGKYVHVIADGGIVNSGDICKAIACGADAVMIGSPIAKSKEAPGYGFHWGMATPNAVLPRGARVEVGTVASLKEILLGPSNSDDGSQNFSGAIATCLATLGAKNLSELQNIEVIVAPSLLTEGKIYQKAQSLGMYK